MTVRELIAALETLPTECLDQPVVVVYDTCWLHLIVGVEASAREDKVIIHTE